jgi:translation initiation factor IF-1
MIQPKDKVESVYGTVTEALPNTLFRVMLDGHAMEDTSGLVLAYLSGKMRMHRIKVLVGDRVVVVLDSYGGKGRIIKRM